MKEEWRSESQPNIGDNYHHSAEGVYLGFKTLRGRKQGLAPYIQVTNQREKNCQREKGALAWLIHTKGVDTIMRTKIKLEV